MDDDGIDWGTIPADESAGAAWAWRAFALFLVACACYVVYVLATLPPRR